MRRLLLALILVPIMVLAQTEGVLIKEMKFENVNLDTVLKALVKITGKNIIIDPAINETPPNIGSGFWIHGRYSARVYTYKDRMNQKVNIVINKPMPVNEALKLIMKEFGLIAVPIDKDTYKITALAKLEIGITDMKDRDVNEFLGLIKSAVSPSAEVVIDKKAGLILITDSKDKIAYLYNSLERYVQGKAQDSFDVDIAGLDDRDVSKVIAFLKQRFPNAEVDVDKNLGFIRVYASKDDIATMKAYLERYIEQRFKSKAKERYTTKVFFLKEIVSPQEAMKILEPILSEEAFITESETFNAIVIRDRQSKILEYAKALEKFLKERPADRKPVTKIFYLKYITPQEFVKMIQPMRSEAGFIFYSQQVVRTRGQGTGATAGAGGVPRTGAGAGTTGPYMYESETQVRQELSTMLSDFNAVMITDYPEVIERIKERFSQYISDSPLQVKIESRILEVRKEVLETLGMDWDLLLSPVGFPKHWRKGVKVGKDGGVLTLVFQKGTLNSLNLKLSAYEKIGKAKNIAKPTVITVSGNQAVISQGQEIPYVTTQIVGGAITQTTQFKRVVLQLTVTPIVAPDDKILLNINIRYDTLGTATDAGPAIDTKELKTKVVVNHGDTVVIGGVLDKKENITTDGVPKLTRVPLLKWILGQENITTTDNELLIFITPMVLRE